MQALRILVLISQLVLKLTWMKVLFRMNITAVKYLWKVSVGMLNRWLGTKCGICEVKEKEKK
jgi:hypothetical protein